MMKPIQFPKGWKTLHLSAIAARLQEIDQELEQETVDIDLVIEKYGFKNKAHYEEFSTSIRREDLQPVEGISLEVWVTAFVSSLKAEDMNQALHITGKDQAAWKRINQEWSIRMANDATMVILRTYTNAIKNAVSTVEETDITASIPFERYVEIEMAIDALHAQGKDRQEILDHFEHSILQWLDATIHWKKEIQANNTKYKPLYKKYEAQYKMKYEAGDSHTDIEF